MTVLAHPLADQDAFEDLHPAAQRYAAAAVPQSTSGSYQRAYFAFGAWCSHRGLEAPTDGDLAHYLADLADRGLAYATISLYRTGIDQVRKAYRMPPLSGAKTQATLKGIARVLGRDPRQARPIVASRLKTLIDAMGRRSPLDIRDRALFLTMWHGALRVSEAAGLDWHDMGEDMLGRTLALRRTKGARDGRVQHVGLAAADLAEYCPIRALDAWRRENRTDGPVFVAAHRGRRETVTMTRRRLSRHGIGQILRQRLAKAGFEPDGFTTHSFRAGFITEAGAQGKPLLKISSHARHRQLAQTQGYFRDREGGFERVGKGLLG